MAEISTAVLQRLESLRQKADRVKRKLLFISPVESHLPVDCRDQAASDLIRSQLTQDVPCLIGRIGKVELDVIIRYLNIDESGNHWNKLYRYLFKGRGPYWWDDQIREIMHTKAGFIPTSDENLARFAARMLEAVVDIDVLGSWLPGETRINHLCPAARVIPLRDLEPYYHPDPWSQALEGKKVLVLHPFETSIRHQYRIRDQLFQNPKVLPQFELHTFKALYAIDGLPKGFSDWFDALDWMCQQIASIDFEVALVGAGPYGMPIAASIKRLGKKAVVLGGATQILFGIRGRRWDRMPFFQDLYKSSWIRPLPVDTPLNFQKVEGGCYW